MRSALVACLLLCACGHERAAVISARVMKPESGTQTAAEGASGTLTCPNAIPQDLGTVDEDGQLRAQHIGAIPLECTVTIALRGYQPFTARVVDICKEVASKACANADLAVLLAAAAQGTGSNAGK
jgi:hypothetical protein